MAVADLWHIEESRFYGGGGGWCHGCSFAVISEKRVFGDVKYTSQRRHMRIGDFFSQKDKGFCHCTAYGAVLCGTPFTTCRK